MRVSRIRAGLTSIYVVFTMVTLGFIGVLIFEGVVDECSVEAPKIIIVDCNGEGNYVKIQDAIDAAGAGDTIYVWAGNYSEYLFINKSINLIGNGSYKTNIHCGHIYNGITIGADFVNVSGFTITGGRVNGYNSGIYLYRANNCLINNNTLIANGFGITLERSTNNTIINNNCLCSWNGIDLYYGCDNNIFENNTIAWNKIGIEIFESNNSKINNNICDHNSIGIELMWCNYNSITNNSFNWNGDGIVLYGDCDYTKVTNNEFKHNRGDGISVISSEEIIILNNTFVECGLDIQSNTLEEILSYSINKKNTVNSKPLYFWKNKNNAKVPADAGQVILVNCENITVKNQNLSNGSYGIQLYSCNNNRIMRNVCNSNCWYGIQLINSSSNLISNNTASDNFECGIKIDGSYNKIKDNICINNSYVGIDCNGYEKNIKNIVTRNKCNSNSHGIALVSNNCTIKDNECNNNNGVGILVQTSSFNSITNNNCQNNLDGISLNIDCNKNTISNNTCISNVNRYGIGLTYSCDSNTIINNKCNKNGQGIRILDSSYNKVLKNECNLNSRFGIFIWGSAYWDNELPSDYNIVNNNTCKSNKEQGIYLLAARYITVNNNSLFSCGLTIHISSKYMDSHRIENNTVNNKPLYYWTNVYGGKVPTGAGQIILINCQNIIIENQTLSNTNYGIALAFSNNNIIRNNYFSGNLVGISIGHSDLNTIINNTCVYNKHAGITIGGDSNTVEANNCSYNDYDGMNVWGSSNTIKNNDCNYNSDDGISIGYIDHNIVSNNFKFNKNCGIRIDSASNIKVLDNNCSYNFDGIFIDDSETCTIINNSMYDCGIYLKDLWWSYKGHYYSSHTIDNYNTINGKPLYYWKNINGGEVPAGAGEVILVNCENITVSNQNLSNTSIGIQIIDSKNCIIRNNTCSNNVYKGISLLVSESIILENNTCNNNYHTTWMEYDYTGVGIEILYSNYIILRNNTCFSNNLNGITYKGSYYSKLEHNNCSYNNGSGISIEGSVGNKFKNNTLIANYEAGILFGSGYNNNFSENRFISCGLGMFGYSFFNWDLLFYNIDSSNTIDGKPIYYWKNKTGLKVPANAGAIFLINCSYVTVENQNLSNGYNGITIALSHNNTVQNCTFNSNFNDGVFLFYSHDNNIKNNSCSFNNQNGIFLSRSCRNLIEENDFKKNVKSGIELEGAAWSESMFGTLNQPLINISGYYLPIQSYFNLLKNNIFKKNNIGIFIFFSSNNTIFYNIIINNTYGIYLLNDYDEYWGGGYNEIYHNDFISNKYPVYDRGYLNIWNNDKLEGNYWSDYNGTDNGAYGRKPYDGIGDTDLPCFSIFDWGYYYYHIYYYYYPGDYFPLTTPIEYLYHPSQPRLKDPGDLDSDGNYTVKWNKCSKTVGYILEEDTNDAFESPNQIHVNSSNSLEIFNKKNGTYFYRVKSFNQNFESKWSNIVNITIDWPPNIPKNLTTSTYPPGNALNLSWNFNEIDTEEYLIYSNQTGNWSELVIFTNSINTFDHTGLTDGKMYYYRIQARDGRGQVSEFSKVITGVPWDSIAPEPPTGLQVISTTHNLTYLTWEPNTEDDLEGYNIYRRKISEPKSWGKPIGTVKKTTEQFIDTGLEELTTYYYVITAFDEVPNESGFSNLASGTTLLGQYGPEINYSVADFQMPEDTVDDTSINLFQWFKDRNHDPLMFWCEGAENISVYIYHSNGTVTRLF
jgi:parallel beta-helix repeat protein